MLRGPLLTVPSPLGVVSPSLAHMAKRITSLKDCDLLTSFLKAHVKENPGKSAIWKNDDIEVVVESYQDFLCAVAGTGHLLDTANFLPVLRKHFEGETAMLKKFAQAMTRALSSCWGKGKGMSSGKKTTQLCLRW